MRSMHTDNQFSAVHVIRRQSVTCLGAAIVLLVGARFLQTRLEAPAEASRAAVQASVAATSPDRFKHELLPFLQHYCVDCHGGGSSEGDFAFDRYQDLDAVKRDRQLWTRVLKRLKFEVMPPVDADQPLAEERTRAVKWLDQQLFYVDCNSPPDPGRVTVRRLNKTEYNNTVRDLLGIVSSLPTIFPPMTPATVSTTSATC